MLFAGDMCSSGFGVDISLCTFDHWFKVILRHSACCKALQQRLNASVCDGETVCAVPSEQPNLDSLSLPDYSVYMQHTLPYV